MINCNPETVSTDYDTSDRLYFEPLPPRTCWPFSTRSASAGSLKGVIVQFGGQTPLKLAHAIEQAGAPILGTSVDFDRSRGGSRPLQAAARQARPEAAEERHRLFGRAGAPHRRRSRPAAGGAPVLCARRSGDGDHPRSDRARRLPAWRAAEPGAVRRQGALPERQDRPDQHRLRQESASVRPLPCGRDRDRCRRPERRRDGRRRRNHGAHRRGRHSLRRQRLLAAAALAHRRDDREPQGPNAASWRARSRSAAS